DDSAESLRHIERTADRAPDDLDVLAILERLVDRTVAKAGQDEVLGHALGVDLPELFVHPPPELSEPHGRQATRPAFMGSRHPGLRPAHGADRIPASKRQPPGVIPL